MAVLAWPCSPGRDVNGDFSDISKRKPRCPMGLSARQRIWSDTRQIPLAPRGILGTWRQPGVVAGRQRPRLQVSVRFSLRFQLSSGCPRMLGVGGKSEGVWMVCVSFVTFGRQKLSRKLHQASRLPYQIKTELSA